MITPISPLTTTKIGFKKNPIPNKSVSSDILKQEEQEIKKRSNGYILAGTALAIAGVTIGSILYIKKPNKISGIKLLKEAQDTYLLATIFQIKEQAFLYLLQFALSTLLYALPKTAFPRLWYL